MEIEVSFVLNGKRVTVKAPPAKSLLRVLREDLDITSPKPGCEAGECGACTVLLDGKAVTSCLVMISQVQDREIWTDEGLVKDGQLDPIQKAIAEEGGSQCGYCTPGFVMSAKALLNSNPHPTEKEIVESISGNICRCGAYPRLVQAIKKVANE
ncbi:MAG: (2Fe-2S)-binding protein [Nitrososphaerota archaeon]|jgi:aerobic-type carbon monoxide dehydrogenase small subunit (CoxS/CutS family)|nr:(2Fe-2S)-binding protein [Nitrososphaerota archaeon]MDG7044373.1 (2Fe-2S)-binding protein [Nitrososphaerota archaeon]MDG7048577.1 (2Fe-2S)-binding protein [Nitrososphaerota archaeon]MDG7051107.1 (2Fe-2S)-binding protein [Nitrososphaerota archaeon]